MDLRTPLDQLELGLGPSRDEWIHKAIEFVRQHLAHHEDITSDDVQDWADRTGTHPPQKTGGNLYGVLFSKLKRLGLRRTTEEVLSRIKSNNGRKVRKWVPTSDWVASRARGRGAA